MAGLQGSGRPIPLDNGATSSQGIIDFSNHCVENIKAKRIRRHASKITAQYFLRTWRTPGEVNGLGASKVQFGDSIDRW